MGFGNVVKFLLLGSPRDGGWEAGSKDLTTSPCLFTNSTIPTWWSQYPSGNPVLTGWLSGSRTQAVMHLDETKLVELALSSLAKAFKIAEAHLKRDLVAGAEPWIGETMNSRGAPIPTSHSRQGNALAASQLEQR